MLVQSLREIYAQVFFWRETEYVWPYVRFMTNDSEQTQGTVLPAALYVLGGVTGSDMLGAGRILVSGK